MTSVARIRVVWSGSPVVGPGVSTFYADGAITTGWAAALNALFTAVKNNVAAGVQWQIPSTVDILDVATGKLTQIQSSDPGSTVIANGSPVDYKPGVGGRIRWITGGVTAGRRCTGTTFIVPTNSAEVPNGILQGGTVTAWTNAANAYRASTSFTPVIYTKPTVTRTVNGKTVTGHAGATHPITAVQVPTAMTWLRTRRS